MKTLVAFTASWCGPCGRLKPFIAKLESYGYPIEHVDIDEQPDRAAEFGIQGIPTIVSVEDNKEIERVFNPRPMALKIFAEEQFPSVEHPEQ